MHLKGGIDAVLMKRYRDRKSDAKVAFDEAGGYNDIDRARAHPPEGMLLQNWNKTIDFFCTPEYRRRSDANKGTRQKQQYTNRGGTSTYTNACFKSVMLCIYITACFKSIMLCFKSNFLLLNRVERKSNNSRRLTPAKMGHGTVTWLINNM